MTKEQVITFFKNKLSDHIDTVTILDDWLTIRNKYFFKLIKNKEFEITNQIVGNKNIWSIKDNHTQEIMDIKIHIN